MRHVCPECGDAGERGACPRDNVPRVPIGADGLLGERVGSWRIASLLGAGGMGRVYKAVQPEIGARVAIKVLKKDAAADAELVERFFNEARAVNVIRHDSIVDVIDLGRLEDNSPYIVMEFLEGSSLAALLRRPERLPIGTFVKWIAEALDAIAAAHGKGIVHRDLKPDNIFISPTGRVTVLDFGIAKLGDLAGVPSGTTQTGILLGTPAYMAPEQARSLPVDARADLYAAGVILFEGATGKQPFAAASLYELLDHHVKTAPPTPRSLEPSVPEALETVILRALAKDPGDRHASAAEMRAALLASVEGLPADAFAQVTIAGAAKTTVVSTTGATAVTQSSLAHGETVPSTPPSPPKKRFPATTAAIIGGVAVVGIGTAVFVQRLRGTEPSSPPADAASQVVVIEPIADAAVVPAVPDAPAIVVAEVLDASSPPGDVRKGKPDAAVMADAAEIAASAPVDAVLRPDAADPWRDLPAASPQALAENGAVKLSVGDVGSFDVFRGLTLMQGMAEKLTGAKVHALSLNWQFVDRTGRIDGRGAGSAHYVFLLDQPRPDGRCYVDAQVVDGIAHMALGSGNCSGRITTRCTLAELFAAAKAEGLGDDVELVTIQKYGLYWQMSDGKGFEANIKDTECGATKD